MNKKYSIVFALCLFALLPLTITFTNKAKSSLTLALEPQERAVPLLVDGTLPSWLSGSLIRNSAIPVYKDGKQITHEFDGIAMLHKCSFHQGKVHYQSRYLNSKEYNDVVVDGRADFMGFGTVSSQQEQPTAQDNDINNASVNLITYNNSFVALTESPLPVRFDGKTLQTLGSFEYQDDLPTSRCWESAHPHYDVEKKEIVNYLIEFGRQCYYVVYRIKEGSNAREVIAKIPVERTSYMHSFAMTDNYVIFTEFPLLLNPQDLMDQSVPFINKFQWLPQLGTRFLIVDRKSGSLVLQKAVDPIFCFHHANAYETGDDIIVDLVAYPDISSMPTIFPQATSIPHDPKKWKNRLLRYQVSLKEGTIDSTSLIDAAELEMPRFADRLDGKYYRYLYMTHSDQKSTGGLVKVDLSTKESVTWNATNFEACEPIFVASPTATSEDDGVILTIIGDKKQNLAFLVVLDGKTFREIARAKLPYTIPASFHGQFFDETLFITSITEMN